MRVIICYNPNNHSHAITNSAMRFHEKGQLDNVELEIFNVEKRNLLKHLNKLNKESNLPDAIYMYKNPNVLYAEKYNQMLAEFVSRVNLAYPEISVVTYDNSVSYEGSYKTEMVQGEINKKSYCLLEKIELDMVNGFKDILVYEVNYKSKTVREVLRNAFDIQHIKGNMYNCYLEKDDAVNKIAEFAKYEEDSYRKKIMKLSNELNLLIKELEDKELENDLALVKLVNECKIN